MQRRTKIVATLGPATDREGVLDALVQAGVNVVRMNFSHGSPQDHIQRAEMVRTLASKHQRHIAILGDLQGPKIRISRFKDGPIHLGIGDKFILDATLDKEEGTPTAVGIDYQSLPNDCATGDLLLLDDGRVVLTVEKVEEEKIYCEVTVGGPLSNNKGINRQGGGLRGGG